MENNRSYEEKVCYNISMIDLIENPKIEEFKTEITKTIINLTENHIKHHMDEFCVKNLIEQLMTNKYKSFLRILRIKSLMT